MDMDMTKTSFGSMSVLLSQKDAPLIEHLIFEEGGRPHIHAEYEYFFVLSGSGIVAVGKDRVEVKKGSLVKIPPKKKHWMIPDEGFTMEGFLWYSSEDVTKIS